VVVWLALVVVVSVVVELYVPATWLPVLLAVCVLAALVVA
jgi:hypothetical protein